MRLSEDAFWMMPMGLFLDLWACHKQWLGMEKPYRELSVDDIIPF
jgi:hypothetical protein